MRIARELIQEGADLRHPEVIECDAHWRATGLAMRLKVFEDLRPLQNSESLTLKTAATVIALLEELRNQFVMSDDEVGVKELQCLAIDARDRAGKDANDKSLPATIRKVQGEIAEWLRVWLETPQLFGEWLELRKSSPGFRDNFGDD